ncbi:hypothetical protein D187_008638 [Cystobacter fuscus DSM 2262]|uniref:Uncharacterized protein n=1 Tax=Cystobacter fuscus (strain ATCC 25194 / DSM 2262 / NBRC 100088 / M29) TaxID=1242864 RepID=S9PDJ4_CYSF2|nr:hypothetical protein D187_008638 [Cystobacter fuscus DSM 2262]
MRMSLSTIAGPLIQLQVMASDNAWPAPSPEKPHPGRRGVSSRAT